MKTLDFKIFKEAYDKGFNIAIQCEGELLTRTHRPTDDMLHPDCSKADGFILDLVEHNRSVDVSDISLFKNCSKDEDESGVVHYWIGWTNCLDGEERVYDYSVKLDELLDLNKLIKNYIDELNGNLGKIVGENDEI